MRRLYASCPACAVVVRHARHLDGLGRFRLGPERPVRWGGVPHPRRRRGPGNACLHGVGAEFTFRGRAVVPWRCCGSPPGVLAAVRLPGRKHSGWIDLDRAFWKTMDPEKYGIWTITAPGGSSRSLRCRFKDDDGHAFEHDPFERRWATYGGVSHG